MFIHDRSYWYTNVFISFCNFITKFESYFKFNCYSIQSAAVVSEYRNMIEIVRVTVTENDVEFIESSFPPCNFFPHGAYI